jgi:hypothetical protein
MFRTVLDLALPVVLATLLIAAAVGAAIADAPSRPDRGAVAPTGTPAP